jgi:hypothetical protein
MGRVEALVEVDAEESFMVFLKKNLDWASSGVCDLYRYGWGIETIWKQTITIWLFLHPDPMGQHLVWVARFNCFCISTFLKDHLPPRLISEACLLKSGLMGRL